MPKRDSLFTIRTAILCDDVRREDNGKFLAIGVYTDGVLLSQRPAPVQGQLLLFMTLNSTRAHKVELELSGPLLKSRATLELPASEIAERSFNTTAPVICFVENNAELSLRWRIDGSAWRPHQSWTLKFSDNAINTEQRLAEQAKQAVLQAAATLSGNPVRPKAE